MALPGVSVEQGGFGPFFLTDRRRASPPRRFSAAPYSVGFIKVQFQDQGNAGSDAPSGAFGHSVPVSFWNIYVCDYPNAPLLPTGQDIINRGVVVDQVNSFGNGDFLTKIVALPNRTSVYVVVAGVSAVSGTIGGATQPALVDASAGAVTGINGPVTLPIGPILTVPFTDSYGAPLVHVQPGFFAPAVLGTFFAMELHVAGAYGISDVIELGNQTVYPYNTGGQFVRGDIVVPADSGAWSGTASFTLFSVNVVRVSGPVFTAGLVGKSITGSFGSYVIGSFSDANNISLNTNFASPSNTYAAAVANAVTFYFVNVDRYGNRPFDITTCPSYVGAIA